jgi:hypothetical protein
MKTSQTVEKIAPSLLKAQKEITFAIKDSTNPHFKSSYADLESVIEAIKKPLNDNGIIFMQSFSPSEAGKLNLTTRLMHESGEWIEDELTMPLQKNDAQGYGSAATYSRRYALAAITGLYQADDDGNEASKPKTLSDNQQKELATQIKIADEIPKIGILLKNAKNLGASEAQLELLTALATSRKQSLLGEQA